MPELTRENIKMITLVSLVGAWFYCLVASIAIELSKPDYSGNELSLKAVQTIIGIEMIRY